LVNRKGKHLLGKILLLGTATLLIFVFYSSTPVDNGVYFFFVPIALASFMLFSREHRNFSYLFVLFILFLYTITTVFDFSLIAVEVEPGEYPFLFPLNFVISLIICVLLLQTTMSIGYQTEKSLKNTAKELRNSKKAYEMALKGSEAGIWDWDIRHNMVSVSRAWLRLVGYPTIGQPVLNIDEVIARIHPDDKRHVRAAVTKHLLLKEPYKTEYRIVTTGGQIRWVTDSGIGEWDKKNGKAIRMVGSIIDIDERKRHQNKVIEQNILLEKAYKELDRFVYSTSHELREPLRSVIGLANIAELETEIEQLKPIVSMIKGRVVQLDNFIQEILKYAQNVEQEVEFEEVDFKAILNSVITELSQVDNFNYIKLKKKLTGVNVFRTDPKRLKMILHNILMNAIRFQDHEKNEPYIKIKTRNFKDVIEIKIEDNGDGISKESMEKVFDMFYRGSNKSDGYGLGLYIVKEALNKMGGKISAKSIEKVGTTFTVVLPTA